MKTQARNAILIGLAVVLGLLFFFALRQMHDPWIAYAGIGRLDPVKDTVVETKVFNTKDNAFYCRMKLDYPKEGWTLRARWIAVDVPGGPPNEQITVGTTPLKADQNTVQVDLRRPDGFPKGKYRLELYMDPPNKHDKDPIQVLDWSVE